MVERFKPLLTSTTLICPLEFSIYLCPYSLLDRMATKKDLINAVRDSLKADGELARIKAEMRTEVIRLLDSSGKGNKEKETKMPRDILLINELIREYLDWMGYKYSSTVFVAECDLPKQSCDRILITESLGVKESENSRSLPLLCSMIETFKKMRNT